MHRVTQTYGIVTFIESLNEDLDSLYTRYLLNIAQSWSFSWENSDRIRYRKWQSFNKYRLNNITSWSSLHIWVQWRKSWNGMRRILVN